MTIIEAIAAAMIKWLVGWMDGREAKKQNQAAQANSDQAAKESAQIRDTTAAQVDASHAQTNDDLNRLHAADSLRDQSEAVQRAIDAANRGVQ